MSIEQTTIQLGHKVRDVANGFEGVATSRTDFLTGNVQFNVQPPAKKSEYVDPVGIDVVQLEYVSDGVASRVTPEPADVGIVLGEKVKDIITGFEGVATRRNTFMNGCVYFTVLAEVDKDGHTKEDFIEYRRLKVIGKGVVAAIAKKMKAEPTGGPISRPMRRG